MGYVLPCRGSCLVFGDEDFRDTSYVGHGHGHVLRYGMGVFDKKNIRINLTVKV